MENLTYEHIISFIATIIFVAVAGIWSVRKVKSSSDFDTAGRKASWYIITASILGTVVGGAITVGTAQMAYQYGFSACWYAIGCGVGCLGLGFIFAKPLWLSHAKTIPEILSIEYGGTARVFSSIILPMALFLNLMPQVLSAFALLTSMLKISSGTAMVAGVGLMIIYVVFGGVWGVGYAGLASNLLKYAAMCLIAVVVSIKAGGVGGFLGMFPVFPWFSLLGNGLASGIATAMSAMVGIMASQTYIQYVLSAKGVRTARVGALVSGVLIPPVGFVCALVGLFMRFHFPNIDPATAFPLFVLTYINPWFAGIILATLLLVIVGSGAGLALAIGTILTNDIFKKHIKPEATNKQVLAMSRIMIVVILLSTLVLASGNLKSSILGWSVLSMGLRGSAAFLPLIAALFLKGRIYRPAGIAAIIMGPATTLGWHIFVPKGAVDPLYVGIMVGIICIFVGFLKGKEKVVLDGDSKDEVDSP